MPNTIQASANAKITWDISSDDRFHAVMFNDNGVWFEYSKKVSVNHLKTSIREFSKRVPINTVRIRSLSDVGADNCGYRCFYSSINREFTVSKQSKDPNEDDIAYRGLSDNELTSLLGNPSRLLADYWDELYVPDYNYQLQFTWDDGDTNRELDSKSIGRINLCRINGQSAGIMEQFDEDSGVTFRFKWAITPEMESVLKRAAWLSKGNKPERGL